MTGRGVRVAVIDSGVAIPHPHIGAIAGGVSIDETGESPDYRDLIGHGTAVMAAVMEQAPDERATDEKAPDQKAPDEKEPDVEYFAVRVFKLALRTRIDFLLRAIEWSIEQRVDLINLSLGTSNPAHAERFAAIVAKAAAAGATLISPATALPGSLAGVIAVNVDPDCPRDRYRVVTSHGATSGNASREEIEFAASGYPRPIPSVPPERNLNGISFAVANMTRFAARVCANLSDRNYGSICAALDIGSSSNPRNRNRNVGSA